MDPDDRLLQSALWRAALAEPDRLFWVDARDDSAFTVGDLDLLSRRAVAALLAQGLGPGGRAVLPMGGDLEGLVTLLGALRLGVATALLHPGAPASVLAQTLALWPGAVPLRAGEGLAEEGVEPAEAPVSVSPEADAVVLFSSGSTGPARGVRLSWRALAGGLGRLAKVEAAPGEASKATGLLGPGAREGVPALLHTVTGCRLSLAPLLRGTTTVLLPPAATAAELLDLAARYEVGVLHGGPGFARAVLRAPERHRGLVGAALRAVAIGGGGLELGERQRLADALGVSVIHTYGLTETAGMIAASVAVPGGEEPAGVGRPIAPVRVVDEQGQRVEGEGFIEVAPGAPCSGYLDGSHPFSDEGRRWVRTGDLGWLDAQGCLHLRGRAARLHTLPSGEKVQLEDLEGHLRAVLGCEALVVGVSEPGREALLGALLVGPPLGPAFERRARLLLRDVVPEAALPRRWLGVPELPLTPTGKVDLRAAAALLAP